MKMRAVAVLALLMGAVLVSQYVLFPLMKGLAKLFFISWFTMIWLIPVALVIGGFLLWRKLRK